MSVGRFGRYGLLLSASGVYAYAHEARCREPCFTSQNGQPAFLLHILVRLLVVIFLNITADNGK